MRQKIKIGTRKSRLALIQTNLVIEQIKIHYPDLEYVIVPIITSGDIIKDKNLYDIGGKALFLKEIEQKLLSNEIDIAVHSLKDVPGKVTDGLIISALLAAEDARDVLVCKNYKSIKELPLGSIVGTSSVRRKIYVEHIRPDLQIVTFRGNVDSRMTKLLNNAVDATILAYAGLSRLNLFNQEYCHIIDATEMLPCIGQGVIAIQIRNNDSNMQALSNKINQLYTWNLLQPQRAFLEYLDASCKTPIAAYSVYVDDKIKTDFMLASDDGKKIVFHSEISSVSNSKETGVKAAKIMLHKIISNL